MYSTLDGLSNDTTHAFQCQLNQLAKINLTKTQLSV